MDDVRQTYTVDEVAALLGVSRATAYAAVKRGDIPSIRLGRKIVVPRAQLEKLLTEWSHRDASSEHG